MKRYATIGEVIALIKGISGASVKKNASPAITETAAGAIVTITDGADNVPVKSLIAQINPVQAGSGDPSPENIRAITARTGCTISHSGEDTSDPEQYTIAFPAEAGTVYGGTLDVTNGILTVNKVKKRVLSVDRKENRYAVHYLGDIGSVITASNTTYCNLLKKYTGVSVSEISDYSYVVYNSSARNHACLGIRFEDEYSTPADYNNKLSELNASGTPLEVVYQLAEPLAVYQLSPVEVSTLLGINNIWADTGDVTVEYRADTKTYIDNQIAALQATILENISNA